MRSFYREKKTFKKKQVLKKLNTKQKLFIQGTVLSVVKWKANKFECEQQKVSNVIFPIILYKLVSFFLPPLRCDAMQYNSRFSLLLFWFKALRMCKRIGAKKNIECTVENSILLVYCSLRVNPYNCWNTKDWLSELNSPMFWD